MKRYLLDTHLIYWWMTADKQLGNATQNLIATSEMRVSTVSLWEMVLKNAKGKLPLPQGQITEQIQSQGFTLLPILPRHIDATHNLICPHPDPFDRLLIAQARDEQLILLTRDSAILALGFDGIEKG